MASPPVYARAPGADVHLCHGEVLLGLIRSRLDPARYTDAEPGVLRVTYAYAVVLSQSCDLMQDFTARQGGKPQLPDVLFCQAPTAEEIRGLCGGSDIWKRIKQNKDERYQFLEGIPADCDACGEGVPELTIDFKRYFTVPTEEVYYLIQSGQARRRCVLCTPYLEHLGSRLAYFLGRIALPRDHVSV